MSPSPDPEEEGVNRIEELAAYIEDVWPDEVAFLLEQERARLRAAVERLANCDVSYHALLKSDVLALLSPGEEPRT